MCTPTDQHEHCVSACEFQFVPGGSNVQHWADFHNYQSLLQFYLAANKRKRMPGSIYYIGMCRVGSYAHTLCKHVVSYFEGRIWNFPHLSQLCIVQTIVCTDNTAVYTEPVSRIVNIYFMVFTSYSVKLK